MGARLGKKRERNIRYRIHTEQAMDNRCKVRQELSNEHYIQNIHRAGNGQ